MSSPPIAVGFRSSRRRGFARSLDPDGSEVGQGGRGEDAKLGGTAGMT